MKDMEKIIFHPIRMRIIQMIAQSRTATVAALAEGLADIPRSTICLLYTSGRPAGDQQQHRESAADHGRPEMQDRHLRIVPGQPLHRAKHYIR